MTTPVQYEFTDEQNGIISNLSKHMGELGAFLQVVGALYLLVGVISIVAALQDAEKVGSAFGGLLSGGLYFVMGMWTRQASAAFKKVVDTSGEDMLHLMSALDRLRALYKTLVTVIKIVFVIVIVGIVAAIAIPMLMTR